MNQVSRPMQIALAAVLVFSLVWFAVLRPKDDVAATPVTPAETSVPRADAGGEQAASALGKTIETAKNGAANADAATKARESQTGEDTSSAAAPASTPQAKKDAAAPAATTQPATPAAKSSAGEKAEKTEKSSASPAQERADKVITKISKDLAKRRAVVVLVWAKSGKEDKIVHQRIRKEIDRRKGKVRVYFIPVNEVGRYDGLLSGLSLGQIPSTIVIAPNNQAKVLGGLVSTARIDRLTSSATLTKPETDAKK